MPSIDKKKVIIVVLICIQVLMIPVLYCWYITQKLSFFDFSRLALYPACVVLLVILIYAISKRAWLLIGSVVVTGALVGGADYLTEAYVVSQDADNKVQALLIIDDLYDYHEKNGAWPDSLSQATTRDTEWTLGFWSHEFRYTKKDSTFEFRFPAENGASWRWYAESQQLGWYD